VHLGLAEEATGVRDGDRVFGSCTRTLTYIFRPNTGVVLHSDDGRADQPNRGPKAENTCDGYRRSSLTRMFLPPKHIHPTRGSNERISLVRLSMALEHLLYDTIMHGRELVCVSIVRSVA
jgi:hypothetical protein